MHGVGALHGGEEQDEGDGDDQTVETDPEGRFFRSRELVGKGKFKTVFKGFDQQQGIDVAWSKLDVSGLNSTELHTVLHDIQTNLHLDHPNIIKSFKCWEDQPTGTINLITELFTSGNLRQYRNHYKQLDLKAVKRMAKQILRGLEYLHALEPPITHGDLRCDKIYVNGNSGEIKIGDIGLATLLPYRSDGASTAAAGVSQGLQESTVVSQGQMQGPGQGQGQGQGQGSPGQPSQSSWGSPGVQHQVSQGQQHQSSPGAQHQAERVSPGTQHQGLRGSPSSRRPAAPCDPSSDMFAFGLCMLELLTLKQLDPQHCTGWQQLLASVPDEEARLLIARCLSEPCPTASELLQHPWLQALRKTPTGGEERALAPAAPRELPAWPRVVQEPDVPPPTNSKLRGEDYLFEFAGKVKDGKMHFRLIMTQATQEPANSNAPAFMRTIDFVFDPDVDTADKLAAEISETFNLSPTDTEICAAALREWLAREMPGLAENGK